MDIFRKVLCDSDSLSWKDDRYSLNRVCSCGWYQMRAVVSFCSPHISLTSEPWNHVGPHVFIWWSICPFVFETTRFCVLSCSCPYNLPRSLCNHAYRRHHQIQFQTRWVFQQTTWKRRSLCIGMAIRVSFINTPEAVNRPRLRITVTEGCLINCFAFHPLCLNSHILWFWCSRAGMGWLWAKLRALNRHITQMRQQTSSTHYRMLRSKFFFTSPPRYSAHDNLMCWNVLRFMVLCSFRASYYLLLTLQSSVRPWFFVNFHFFCVRGRFCSSSHWTLSFIALSLIWSFGFFLGCAW